MSIEVNELAWAAGLFDGEGSTSVSRRGGALRIDGTPYRRVVVTVGQSAAVGAPEVLVRFRKAVLGLGAVHGPYGPHGRSRLPMWHFQATKWEEAQAIIALLWKFLSPPKRAQAVVALRAFREQARFGRLPRADCKRKHGWVNVRLEKDGSRFCRDCRNARDRERRGQA